jgi:hypothetical protein
MAEKSAAECCPPFDPNPWNEQEVVWDGKLVLRTHVRCLFHIPLNFGGVMRRVMAKIAEASAAAEEIIVLSEDESLWRSTVYIAVGQEVPDEDMVALSGTFMCKVFEGPYRNMGKWIAEMKAFLESRDIFSRKMYFYYTTCPKCAKKYGKNYVVMLAKYDPET